MSESGLSPAAAGRKKVAVVGCGGWGTALALLLNEIGHEVTRLTGERERITFLQGTPFQSLGVLEGVMEIPGYEAKEGAPSPPSSID